MLTNILNPTYYHRQYEQDLPQATGDSSYLATAKRAGCLILPFLSLYRPFGQAISVTMGSARLLSSGVGVLSARDRKAQAYQAMQVGLAGLALAGSLYNFRLGLYLTTVVDLTTNLVNTVQNPNNAPESLFNALNSSLYLSIMMTGSSEMVRASLFAQAALNFYQAREEYKKGGRLPEVIAKVAMGMIRYQQFQNIQYHIIRKPVDKSDHHLKNHPLKNLSEKIKENEVILEDGNGKKHNFGAYFYGYGKQVVKGMNLHFRRGEKQTALTFKLNHVFRDRLQERLKALNWISDEKTMILGKAFEQIQVPNLGTVFFGADKFHLSKYDQITVLMDNDRPLEDYHKMLSTIDLDDALRVSSAEDIDRMKMGHLYRILAPRQASPFERSDAFFELSLDGLKREMFQRAPSIEKNFTEKFPKMELREVLPGKMRWTIPGLSDELQKQGLWGLTHGLANKVNLASILKRGMLSNEMAEMHLGGSRSFEHLRGGADSVFTQVVTQNRLLSLSYWNPVRILFSPKILEYGTYQYQDDHFGCREEERYFCPYFSRLNIFEFLRREMYISTTKNEVMIKDRIPPEYITGVCFNDENTKRQMIDDLRKKGLIKKSTSGEETIFSKPLEQFFHIGSQFKKEYFDS